LALAGKPGGPADIRLFADAAVLVAEAGRTHVGVGSHGAESAGNGQGGDNAEDDLLHNETPFVNTKTTSDSNTLLESTFLDTPEPPLNDFRNRRLVP